MSDDDYEWLDVFSLEFGQYDIQTNPRTGVWRHRRRLGVADMPVSFIGYIPWREMKWIPGAPPGFFDEMGLRGLTTKPHKTLWVRFKHWFAGWFQWAS